MDSDTPCRRNRWQFSLRALLVLMALAGVGLVIYRWPWEEEFDTGPSSHAGHLIGTMPYRRGWTGSPVKHGLMKGRYAHGVTIERFYYEDVPQRERLFEASGKLRGDFVYRNGVLHGPCFSEYAGIRSVGTYRDGERHGKWQTVWEEEQYTVDEEYSAGKRHGKTTWTTPAGRWLQSAAYDHGALIEWNGKPVAEELNRWLAANLADAEARRNLQETVPPPDPIEGQRLPYGEVLYFVGNPPRPVVIHWNSMFGHANTDWRGRSFGESLLDVALAFSCTFSVRYGVLHVIRITEAEVAWQDQTGVDDVRFAPGSQQEQDWLGPTTVPGCYDRHPLELVRQLLSPASGCSIELDTSAVDALESPFSGPTGTTLTAPPLPLRDIVGEHLNRGGYRCEQQGNTLIIKVRASTQATP